MAKDKIVNYITKDPADLMNANKHQSAVVYDLLSEGPIEGLDNGLASIYFNGTPIMDPNLWNAYKPKRTAEGLTCTTSDGAVTVPTNFSTTYHSLKDGDRYLRIQKALKKLTGNGSSTGVTTVAD